MSNFSRYFCGKRGVVPYVEGIKMSSSPGSVLTTIIQPEPLGGFYVRTATDASSEDTEKEMTRCLFFSPRTTISIETIPAG